jgi:hypothetical protein
MLRMVLVSLALVAAAIALGGGLRGMSDGGLRASTGVVIVVEDSLTGFSDGGLSGRVDDPSDDPLGLSDGGLRGMSDGGLLGFSDGGLLGLSDGGLY